MRSRALLLCLACACTQDFGQFEPKDDAAAPSESGTDASGPDATADATGPETGGPDAAAPDAAPEAGVPCTETGAIQYGGHCYFLVSTTQNFNAAKSGCTGAGAHLVTITTAGEQAAVIALGTGTERWIGLYRNGGPAKDAMYTWITGEGRNGFSAWSPGEPNGTGQCGTLLATGLWNDEDCTISLASICERE